VLPSRGETEMKKLTLFAVATAMLLNLFVPLSHATGTWVAFGPQTFVQGPGAPAQVTASFSVLNPNAVCPVFSRF
jgi:hypothetical protein